MGQGAQAYRYALADRFMPPRCPQKNPYQAGDVVQVVYANGAGEGVLWTVTRTGGNYVWIEPALTLTGPSVLRPKREHWGDVEAPDLVTLGIAYQQLGMLIADIARRRGAEKEPEQ